MKRVYSLLCTAIGLLAADVALAEHPPSPPFEERKIGPGVRQSDVVNVPLGYHFDDHFPTPPWAGWAGYKFQVHVLDNTEVDVDSVVYFPFDATGLQNMPVATDNPFGPRSQNVQSQPREWKVVHPRAYDSGIQWQFTDRYRVADLKLHIKGTDNPRQNNSDVDAVVRLWNIWHFRQGATSQIVDLKPSDRIWVGSQVQEIEALHDPAASWYHLPPTIPYPPLSSANGHWLHVQQPIPFHFYGSQFYATLARTFNIGIEHVPEPATMVLSGSGLLCAIMGVRSYRKRRLLL